MPRWIKVLVWTLVFTACAAAGAVVASRTDPFPPGVEDPGARGAEPTSDPSEPPGGAPSPVPARWRLTLSSTSRHTFRVGGSCTTKWTATAVLRIDADGAVTGSGRAERAGAVACDFPVEQVQADELGLDVSGTRAGDDISLVITSAAVTPPGSDDLGGFRASIGTGKIALPIAEGRGSTRVRAEVPDGVGGTRSSVSDLRVRCVAGCEA